MTKKILICIIIFIFTIASLPYIAVEINTLRYGEIAKSLYDQATLIDDNNYCKVVEYSEEKLVVLYVDSTNLSRCYFKNQNGSWKLYHWEVVYSHEGSASEFCYPFYLPMGKK